MNNNKAVPLFFKYCNSAVKSMIEFEKELAELKAAMGKSLDDNPEINELVKWFRNEYVKRPEKYLGDNYVLKELYDNVLKGLSITDAMQKTKDRLIAGFIIIDSMRMLGK